MHASAISGAQRAESVERSQPGANARRRFCLPRRSSSCTIRHACFRQADRRAGRSTGRGNWQFNVPSEPGSRGAMIWRFEPALDAGREQDVGTVTA